MLILSLSLLLQFAVLYGARANTGVDRMKIINAVAKSVPAPHKVDLSNPEMSIVVEIVKVRTRISVNVLSFCINKLVWFWDFVLQFADSMLNWGGREVQGAGKVQSQAAHVDQVTISFSVLFLESPRLGCFYVYW